MQTAETCTGQVLDDAEAVALLQGTAS
jgi:hypothetical protein